MDNALDFRESRGFNVIVGDRWFRPGSVRPELQFNIVASSDRLIHDP